MGRLRANIIANLAGQGWRAAMSLAFVPVYISKLGVEAYALIGLYASLQAWLFLIDMGLRPTLIREMARYSAGGHNEQSIRDLLRSAEVIAGALCMVVALGFWAASGWLAANWLNSETLPVESVAPAMALMGFVAAVQVMESLYAGCIAGLERQVLQNLVTSLMATARGAGGAVVVMLFPGDVLGFFQWQGLVAVVAALLTGGVLYGLLPKAARRPRFSLNAVREVRSYASGMAAITVLTLLLTQIDKVLLARLLPLEIFAHYLLAGLVASSLYYLYGPVVSAFYPRLTALVSAGGCEEDLRRTYHRGAQLVTVLAGSAAAILIMFPDFLLTLWTGNQALALETGPILSLLAAGALLNGLMALPYHLQLAHGWVSLTIGTNSVAVGVVIVALLVFVPRYGVEAAAWVWFVLNLGYVTVGVWLMHRRLLTDAKWGWYLSDVGLPLVGMMSVAWCLRQVFPVDGSPVIMVGALFASGVAIIGVGALLASEIWRLIVPLARGRG